MEQLVKNKIEFSDYDALLGKLWKQSEGRNIDFKAPFIFGKAQKKEMYGLVKDILAMANTEGGGYIVIGRKDAGEAEDCSQDVRDSFDPTDVHKQTKKYGRPEPKFTITEATSPEGTTAIVVCVEEFEEHLVICAENADCEQGKNILRAGAVYIRSKSGDASSAQVVLEQDMRSLIDRSILKSSKKLTGAIESIIGGYLKGITQNNPLKEDSLYWQKEEKLLLNILNDQIPLKGHYLQIIAHPTNYEKLILNDGKTLQNRLTASIAQCNGWSFPCPNFEVTDRQGSAESTEMILTSSRPFQEGELQYGFGLNLSGLMAYQEELCAAYDAYTPGKPLLIYPILVTIYRAIAFFGRFFAFTAGNENLSVNILINDTHQRIPTGRMLSMYNHFDPYYGAGELPHPKIKATFEIPREEFTTSPNEVFSKMIRELFETMNIRMTEEQVMSEIEKFTSLK